MADMEKFTDNETKFNKSLDDLRRISRIQEQCDVTSCMSNTWEGATAWMKALSCLDREISPYLLPADITVLDTFRVKELPGVQYKRLLGPSPPSHVTAQLDLWERELRRLMTKKGMGMIPKDVERSFILPGG